MVRGCSSKVKAKKQESADRSRRSVEGRLRGCSSKVLPGEPLPPGPETVQEAFKCHHTAARCLQEFDASCGSRFVTNVKEDDTGLSPGWNR